MEELGFTSGTAEGTALSAGSAGTVPLLSRIAQHSTRRILTPAPGTRFTYIHAHMSACTYVFLSLPACPPHPLPPEFLHVTSPFLCRFFVSGWKPTITLNLFGFFFFFLVVSLFKVHKTAVKSKQTVAEYLARRRCLLRC